MSRKSNTPQDHQVLFVGQLFPDSMLPQILEQEILPIQTQRFGTTLVDALQAGFDQNVEVFSTAPLVDFPHSRLLFAPRAKWVIDNQIKATMAPFINLPGLKHITRFIVTLIFVGHWILRNRDSRRVIILLGAQSCKLWGVIFAQIFGSCVTVSYLTDDLGIPLKWEKPLLKRMRLMDVSIMKWGLQKFSGVIAMTPKLAEKLAPDRPALIMPTIWRSAPAPAISKTRNPADGTFNIVYTGKLTHSYGLDLLLDTFKQANRSNWRLLISGWGEMDEAVREFAKNNPHVEYLGLLDADKLTELRQRADVFVNPKLTTEYTAGLAFPSKLVEYLGTGKPIVSTNLPIFDDGFRQNLIIARSDSPDELIRCLDTVMSWDSAQRECWRLQTLRFIDHELSPAIQGDRIRNFVDSLKYKELPDGIVQFH